jgi:anti-sigma-K factor RskA
MLGNTSRRPGWRLAAAVSVAATICAGVGATSGSAAGGPTLVVYSAQGYDKAMVAAFKKASATAGVSRRPGQPR